MIEKYRQLIKEELKYGTLQTHRHTNGVKEMFFSILATTISTNTSNANA